MLIYFCYIYNVVFIFKLYLVEVFFVSRLHIIKYLSVERLLEIIGEAANHISEEVLYDEDNSTPWKLIIGLRNILSHEYFRVDSKTIYQLATKDIVPLKKEILRIKNKLENN